MRQSARLFKLYNFIIDFLKLTPQISIGASRLPSLGFRLYQPFALPVPSPFRPVYYPLLDPRAFLQNHRPG